MKTGILLALISLPAFATDDRAPRQEQDQSTEQSQEQHSEQANTQTVESEHQAPATFISTSPATAPCYFVNSWSVGIPGAGGGRGKSKRDDECWAEYVKQAEHERAMDLAKLELEKARLSLDSKALEQCLECGGRK